MKKVKALETEVLKLRKALSRHKEALRELMYEAIDDLNGYVPGQNGRTDLYSKIYPGGIKDPKEEL